MTNIRTAILLSLFYIAIGMSCTRLSATDCLTVNATPSAIQVIGASGTVNFTNCVASGGTGPYTYEWSIPGGSPSTYSGTDAAPAPGSVTYGDPSPSSSYEASVNATDSLGNTGTAKVKVVVAGIVSPFTDPSDDIWYMGGVQTYNSFQNSATFKANPTSLPDGVTFSWAKTTGNYVLFPPSSDTLSDVVAASIGSSTTDDNTITLLHGSDEIDHIDFTVYEVKGCTRMNNPIYRLDLLISRLWTVLTILTATDNMGSTSDMTGMGLNESFTGLYTYPACNWGGHSDGNAEFDSAGEFRDTLSTGLITNYHGTPTIAIPGEAGNGDTVLTWTQHYNAGSKDYGFGDTFDNHTLEFQRGQPTTY
jgi:hypothetical protein